MASTVGQSGHGGVFIIGHPLHSLTVILGIHITAPSNTVTSIVDLRAVIWLKTNIVITW